MGRTAAPRGGFREGFNAPAGLYGCSFVEVVVCSWGGAYTDAQRKAFFDPFERQTGIRVRTVGVPDLAKIRAVEPDHVAGDLMDAVDWALARRVAA